MATAVFGGIFAIMTLIYAFALPQDAFSKKISAFVSKNILLIGFLLSMSALVSSLVYSEIIGYPPCMFCWWARIMFYPQVVLFGRGLIKKDLNILPYTLILTTIGLCITTYHSIIQIVGESPIPCTAGGISCVSRDVFMFGFITIPLMGVVGFAVLLISLAIAKKSSK